MTSLPTFPLMDADEVALLAVTDLWERARLADEIASRLQKRAGFVLRVRREAVRQLVRRGVKQSIVASHLRMSPTRVNQLVKGSEISESTEAVAA